MSKKEVRAVISNVPDPNLTKEFSDLMQATTDSLNKNKTGKKCKTASSDKVENWVYEEMKKCAVNTPFNGSIQLVSGHKFPDIIANVHYGTEVKSTKSDKWESFGNSIFETTRNRDVKCIYVTFAKLGGEIEYKSKPYEQCISGVVVDHSPRYHIDMSIQESGEKTLFEDIGFTYDCFRKLSNVKQVEIIAEKSKANLKPGETLWWHPDIKDYIAPPSIRLISKTDVEELQTEAICFFPELFYDESNRKKFIQKYDRLALWLITDKNVTTHHLRDYFSGGGQTDITMKNGETVKMPGVFKRIEKHRDKISKIINETPKGILKDRWGINKIERGKKKRIQQWINEVIAPVVKESKHTFSNPDVAIQILKEIFKVS